MPAHAAHHFCRKNPPVPSLKFCRRLAALVLACLAFPAALYAYRLEPYRWSASTLPTVVRIYFRFDPPAYNGAFFKAMKQWNAVNKAVELRPGDLGGVGTVCSPESNSATFDYMVCGTKWDESVLAVTLVNYQGDSAQHGTVIFNSNLNFEVYTGPARPGVFDMGRVALHELGHFLGLDHETVAQAIMQPRISDIDTLKPDDINGIRARYSK